MTGPGEDAAGAAARRPALGLLAAFALLLLAGPAVRADAPAARAVDVVGLTVSDMDRSVAFFRDVLAFETLSDVELLGGEWEHLQGVFGLRMRVVQMRLGDERLELTEYLAPRGRPIPWDARSNDRAFQHVAIIVADMDRAYRWLRQNKVTHASTGPQTLPAYITAAAGIRAFYFKDPDGHSLEVLQFPEGKGDPKWRRRALAVGPEATPTQQFLGIDHTAIVVSDTETSLAFYRDGLGLAKVGESENYGAEQEHLNNVFGARLRITALRAPDGPGIEFLEYLAPRDGRPAPADLRANDLLHWQTTLTTLDVRALARKLFALPTFFVSPGVVDLPSPGTGFRRGALVRDPDGHALRLMER